MLKKSRGNKRMNESEFEVLQYFGNIVNNRFAEFFVLQVV